MSGSLDLSNAFIQDTYPRLLQYSGSTVYDGVGDPVILTYTGSFSGSANVTSLTASSVLVTGNVVVQGTASINTLIVNQTQLSTGSNQLGDAPDDFQTLYGTVSIPTGSFTVSGSSRFTNPVNPQILLGYSNAISTSLQTTSDGYFHIAPLGGRVIIDGLYLDISQGTILLGSGGFGGSGDIVFRNTGVAGGLISPVFKIKDSTATLVDGLRFSPTWLNSGSGAYSTLNTVSSVGVNIYQMYASSSGATSVVFNGTVGIGTVTPSASLHISGASTANLLRIDSPSTSSIIYVSGSGVIGFNQTSSLTSQATFRGVLGSLNLTEINTTANGGYGLRTDGPIKGDGYYFYNAGGGNILTSGGVSLMSFDSLRNVGIAVSSSIAARLHVRGTGTTSATTAFRVDNANASASLVVLDDRQTRITSDGAALYVAGAGVAPYSQNIAEFYYSGNGNSLIIAQRNGIAGLTTSPNANLHFEPSGSGVSIFLTGKQVRFNNLFNNGALALQNNGATGESRLDFITGSTTVMSISGSGNVGIGTATPTYRLDVSGSGRFTAGLSITGSAGTGSAVTIYKSGSTAFDIQGSSGQLFAVTDSLTGSLFSVNTAAGLPTIEAFSDNTVNIGKFGSYPLKVVSSGTVATVTGSFSGSIQATAITLTGSLNVSGSQNYNGNVNINGTLTATVKSFLINHPTQPGKKLQYGNLEGPEHGVYFRGKSTSYVIELPEEWTGLVDEETITVQLTSIGKHQSLYVEEIKNNKVTVGISGWTFPQPQLNYFYLIHGERKDVNKLITTVK